MSTSENTIIAGYVLGAISEQADDLATLMFVMIESMENDCEATSRYAAALRPIAIALTGIADETRDGRHAVESD